MIGVNPLRTKVLITTDEVLFHAPTDHQMDPRVILQNIIIAERRFLKPMVGAVVYDLLIDNKNTIVTSANKAVLQTAVNAGRGSDRAVIVLEVGDYVNSDTYLNTAQLTLWQNYLHKITAECVYFAALPVNRSRMTATGVLQNSPNTINNDGKAASIDLRDLKHLMDRALQDRISPLIEDMHQYMCSVGYPGYTRDCGCDSNGVSTRKKTDIILSMYEDDDDCRPCRRIDDDSSSSSYSFAVSQNETIPFEDQSLLVIPWNTNRRQKYGASANITVEVYSIIDGLYHNVIVDVIPDDIDYTTLYTIDLGGIATGRITIG